MTYTETKQDLFSVPKKYALAHCVSADYALGAGIAVEFNKRFSMKQKLMAVGTRDCPDCILIDNVFNLVTKPNYWMKPTYLSMRDAIHKMHNLAVENGIAYIAMPKIGAGLDKFPWSTTRHLICSIFDDTDIHILVCTL